MSYVIQFVDLVGLRAVVRQTDSGEWFVLRADRIYQQREELTPADLDPRGQCWDVPDEQARHASSMGQIVAVIRERALRNAGKHDLPSIAMRSAGRASNGVVAWSPRGRSDVDRGRLRADFASEFISYLSVGDPLRMEVVIDDVSDSNTKTIRKIACSHDPVVKRALKKAHAARSQQTIVRSRGGRPWTQRHGAADVVRASRGLIVAFPYLPSLRSDLISVAHVIECRAFCAPQAAASPAKPEPLDRARSSGPQAGILPPRVVVRSFDLGVGSHALDAHM